MMLRKHSLVGWLWTMALFMTAVSLPSFGWPQSQLPFSTGGFERGMVTEIHQTTIEIDNKTYGLKPEVVIVDDQGQPIEIGSVVTNAEVKFHVKEGRIDKMVVSLPR
ncbi:hypothetical protein [Nitrospira sp. Nam80]